MTISKKKEKKENPKINNWIKKKRRSIAIGVAPIGGEGAADLSAIS